MTHLTLKILAVMRSLRCAEERLAVVVRCMGNFHCCVWVAVGILK